MGKVYWNKKEIPIPEGLHINKNDARVYSLSLDPDGRMKRVVFGYATSEKTMHVNDTFLDAAVVVDKNLLLRLIHILKHVGKHSLDFRLIKYS